MTDEARTLTYRRPVDYSAPPQERSDRFCIDGPTEELSTESARRTPTEEDSPMEQSGIYEQLAHRLNSDVVIGAPMAPSLLGILEVLFPLEEAEIGLVLPFAPQPLSELKKLYPGREDSLEAMLKTMARRGTVLTVEPAGGERVYSLLPTLVGFAETPFWSGKVTEDTKKLSPLWLRYRDEAFAGELARGMPPVRVIPVARSLKEASEILPFDVIKEKLDTVDYLTVAHCPCRMMMRETGQGCDHSLENCMHFGTMGRYMVEQGMAREITKDQAIEILHKADEEGLVHISDNMDGMISTICSCCGCCCTFLQSKKRTGLDTYRRSNYVSVVDAEECAACGTCEDRCPVGAVSVGDDDFSIVNGDLCIGCGVCTPTCKTEAISLVRREQISPPPTPLELVTARREAAG